MNSTQFTKQEQRVVIALSCIFSLRMLGLFMILPIFATYAHQFSNSQKQLVGIAIGAYGLTQALFQIPFGILSDRLGRRKIIFLGLSLLGLGSLFATFSTSIYGIIFGRILQGSGAIGSVVMATLADLTREKVRARSMACLGTTIALSFLVALVVGPLFFQLVGFRGIFILTAILSLVGIAILMTYIPKLDSQCHHIEARINYQGFNQIISTKLLNLYLGVFTLHTILAALFLAVPVMLQEAGYPDKTLWRLYLPLLLGTFTLAILAIFWAEKRAKNILLQICSITLLFPSLGILLYAKYQLIWILIGLSAFFVAFIILEASLPAGISKTTNQSTRGLALGMYSSAQFLGIFFGGLIGGLLDNHFAITGILTFCMFMNLSWLIISVMTNSIGRDASAPHQNVFNSKVSLNHRIK